MAAGHHGSHARLQHHFEDMDQQREAGTLGMWLFLVTEIMFFGVMFLAYVIFRTKFPMEFALGSAELDITLGGINTAILIGSSLTMALAVWGSQVGNRKALVGFLVLTIILGLGFLGIKVVEYQAKFEHHLFPGSSFHYAGAAAHGAEADHAEADHAGDAAEQFGTVGQEFDSSKIQLFFFIYFALTGIHALHMIIGIGLLLVLLRMSLKGNFTPEWHAPIELTGLYWHFVDIAWIFIFPLLYLIGTHL